MKLSILIITYNHAAYIRQALESVLLQRELRDYEIILCDDRSADDTVSIAREILAAQTEVTIHVNERNLGITRNYEQAFAHCQGEYICVLEGDDYWIDPYKIKKQIDFLDAHPYCAMNSHLFLIQQENEKIYSVPPSPGHDRFLLADAKDLILDEGILSNFSTCCYRRTALEKISQSTFGTISFDWMINISIAEHGLLSRLNEPMSVYRHSPTGTWTQLSLEKQLRGTYDILPVYDGILGNRYHLFFEQKRAMIRKKLEDLAVPDPHQQTPGFIPRSYRWVRRKFFNLPVL